MGWLRLVGSLKLYVSFAKEPYKRDYILQKKLIILRSLLIIATPYWDMSVICREVLRQLSHMWMSHVARVNESSLYEWVTSHVWMSHASSVNESCLTCEWVMSHMWMSHVSHVNESCLTCEWVMSHIWMSHGTHMDESSHTCEWVMAHIQMINPLHVNESWHTHTQPSLVPHI